MSIVKLDITKFLELSKSLPVLDVRSPGEYSHAHLPGAYPFPLFTDDERKIVGTTYKQEGREQAIKTGLDMFGVKMRRMVEEVSELIKNHPHSVKGNQTVLVHCWRGGMRSAGVAWLLDLYGYKVYTLIGGYKVFRRWVLDQFERAWQFRILGGYTGSGKTLILEALEKKGHAVINLEKLANHKGSAFGALGEKPQPSQEMFENLLALELASKPESWMEDESQRIGKLIIPNSIWNIMRNSPIHFVDIPFEERLNYITSQYGVFEREKLVNAILRIQKRLGGLETKTAINHLIENDTKECFRILLAYYDKLYKKGLYNRNSLESLLNTLPCRTVDPEENVKYLVQLEAVH